MSPGLSAPRPYRPGEDDPALADICVRTADHGGDATGLLPDDDLWAAVFLAPYLARHPDLALVVDDGEGLAGYVVGTDDSEAFETWFASEWWPPFAARWPRPTAVRGRHDEIASYAWGRGQETNPWAADHPAHLHIDLLPRAQGLGGGRALIETFTERLAARGCPGVHLVAAAENTGTRAFYPRVGFTPLEAPPGSAAFGRRLRPA